MPSYGMVIDLDKCTGCGACVHACAIENNTPAVGAEEAARDHRLDWIRVLRQKRGGEHGGRDGHEAGDDSGRTTFIPVLCNHCDDPPCVKVCPVYATYKNPEGLVGQVYGRCIGCRFCMAACPYTIKVFNWFKYPHPPGMRDALNPDVSERPVGVVEKCSFCHHRLQKAKNKARLEKRELAPGDYVPACVDVCPSEAMTFGDLDDPRTAVAQLARSPRAFRLLPELGTKPKVIYLPEET